MKLRKLVALGAVLTITLGVVTVNAAETSKDKGETKVIEEKSDAIVFDELDELSEEELNKLIENGSFVECGVQDLSAYEFNYDSIKEYVKADATKDQIEKLQTDFDKIAALEAQLEKAYEAVNDSEIIDWESFDKQFTKDMNFDQEQVGFYEDVTVDDIDSMFEDMKEIFKEGLSDEVIKEARLLFGQALELEIEGEYEKALVKWEAFDKLDLFDYASIEFTQVVE